jgi:hypothetical protein
MLCTALINRSCLRSFGNVERFPTPAVITLVSRSVCRCDVMQGHVKYSQLVTASLQNVLMSFSTENTAVSLSCFTVQTLMPDLYLINILPHRKHTACPSQNTNETINKFLKEIVYFGRYTKHINTLFQQNAKCINVYLEGIVTAPVQKLKIRPLGSVAPTTRHPLKLPCF